MFHLLRRLFRSKKSRYSEPKMVQIEPSWNPNRALPTYSEPKVQAARPDGWQLKLEDRPAQGQTTFNEGGIRHL